MPRRFGSLRVGEQELLAHPHQAGGQRSIITHYNKELTAISLTSRWMNIASIFQR